MATSPSRGDLVAAMNLLSKRRASTTDAAEQATIDETIESLEGSLQDLDHAQMLEAVKIVARATDELEKMVASARMAPFDNYLAEIQNIIKRLHDSQAAPATAEDATVPTPMNSKDFMAMRAEYQAYFNKCALRKEHEADLDFYIKRLVANRKEYEDVAASLGGGIPWAFIGIIHGMEGGFNFAKHLHNGDPLSARTGQVPAGHPVAGNPPFSWHDSACDALRLKGYDKETDWSVPRMLYLWEKYNGFGYRPLGVPSPYLWSFSNMYKAGKFVADGKYDPAAVSKQCGSALMLKTLKNMGQA